MDEFLKVVIPATIALVGTLATVLVGYRQWKRQQDKEHSQKFRQDRQLAYNTLWQMLEDVHVKVRTDSVGKREFQELVQGVNSFVLKNSLYIRKADGFIARQYLDAVFKVSQLVAESKDKRAKRQWHATDRLPSDTLKESEKLRAAWDEADKLRDKVVLKFRKIVSGQ